MANSGTADLMNNRERGGELECFKPLTMFLVLSVVVLLFSVVYVRHLCIKTGYEISELSAKIETTEAGYRQKLTEKSRVADYHSLYEKSKKLGFVFPEPKRVFNVR